MFQSRLYNGNITIRYSFLGQDQANWVGMASYYREYLINKYGLQKLSGEGTPFYLELIGAIHREKPFFGIPRIVQEPLTTFKEAEELAVELVADGIDNLHVVYSGWLEGGLHHYYPMQARPEPALGKAGELDALKQAMEERGIALSMGVNFANAWRDSTTDRFSPTSDASRAINRRVARVYYYNPATGDRIGATAGYLVSPASYGKLIPSFVRDFAKYGIGGLARWSLAISSVLISGRPGSVGRSPAVQKIVETQLKYLQENSAHVTVEGGNAYALPYVDTAADTVSEQ